MFFLIVFFVINIHAVCPLYDINKSFEENCRDECTIDIQIPERMLADKSQWKLFLGYPIASQIAVPACAIMTSKGIKLASKLGFDVFTYKTIRSSAHASHPLPNICYVSCDHQICADEIGKNFFAQEKADEDVAISNSIGIPCSGLEWVRKDIAKARSYMREGQVLIVSVLGQGQDENLLAEDFANLAIFAESSGAHVVELNFSCPNIFCAAIYKNERLVNKIVRRVTEKVSIPVIFKVGIFEDKELMKKIFKTANKAGARGVCGINSVPVKIIREDGEPYFGTKRITSGLSGAPIRDLTKRFIKDAKEIIQEEKLDLVILATGGATKPEHLHEFLQLGAEIAMSATGFMWDPQLGIKYQKKFSKK